MVSTIEEYKNKMDWIYSLLGNECKICGRKEDFHIHHLYGKSFTITSGWGRKKEDIIKELSKCILLCKKCHIKIHTKPHGTEARYRNSKCRCPECKEAHRLVMQKYRKERKLRDPGFRKSF